MSGGPRRPRPGAGAAPTRLAMLALLVATWQPGVACREAVPVVSLDPPKKAYTTRDYPTVLRRWTRSARIVKLDDWNTTLKADATWFSPDFARAYAAQYASMFKLPAEEEAALVARLAEETDAAYLFGVSAVTTDMRWNDFDRKRSVWRVALVVDDREVKPERIEAERQITATVTALFPYVDTFARFYRFRFPRTLPDGRPLIGPDSSDVRLRFAGPLGVADLRWRLR